MQNDFTWNFDNFDLSLIGFFHPTRRLPNNMPDRDIKTYDLVRSHGSVPVSSRYTKKVIMLYGAVNAPSREAYEQTMDQIKYRVNSISRPLIIEQAGGLRRYTASCVTLTENFIEQGKSMLTFQFEALDPFGYEPVPTVETYTDTVASFALPTIFGGTTEAKPKFTLTVNSITGGTAKQLSVGNVFIGQMIQVTKNWVPGDVLVVDNATSRVLLNNAPVDYTGFFTEFAPGLGHAGVVDNFTARNITAKVEYIKRYL